MPDITAQFTAINGLAITGNSIINFTSASGPDLDLVLASSGTTGNIFWEYPAAPVHYSGTNAKYLMPIPSTTPSATNTVAVTGQSTFFPFTIYSTINTRAALGSGAVGPTGGAGTTGAGTAWARIYAAGRTSGLPANSVGNYGTITITQNVNTIFTSSDSVVLNPGMYWMGIGFNNSTTQLRRATANTAFSTAAQGQSTPTGSVGYTINFSQAGVTIPPATLTGSFTEGTTTAIVTPFLLVI